MIEIENWEYEDAVADGAGWCSCCNDFVNYGVEPDARNYICEDCGNDTVYGIEEAIVQGMIFVNFMDVDE